MTAISAPKKPANRRSAGAILALLLLAVAAAGCMPGDAKTFLDRTNNLRASHGLRSLQENDTLTRKAEEWAQHMAATGRLEHSNLSSNLGSLRWKALGENVGYSWPTSNTLLTIHNMFVSSAGHRANLLKSNFTHMGVGVAKDSRGRIWVAEVFAQL
jgi:uncharacterized protein YkwD